MKALSFGTYGEFFFNFVSYFFLVHFKLKSFMVMLQSILIRI